MNTARLEKLVSPNLSTKGLVSLGASDFGDTKAFLVCQGSGERFRSLKRLDSLVRHSPTIHSGLAKKGAELRTYV